MTTHDDIRALEEITFRGWPALESETYDGWVLRAARGYTGRANSINPLYPSSQRLDDKIAYCDAWYAARGITPIYRLNDAMQPPDLDAQLAARGYHRFNASRVMVREVEEALPPNDATFSTSPALTDAWLADLCRLNARHAPHIPTIRLLIDRMPPQRLFACVRVGDETATIGLGVLHDGHLGLYDIVTDERRRGRGYGRLLVSGLLHAAHEAGIARAYLQVAADNAPAIRLYEGLGFRLSYGYWYRGTQRG